MVMKENEDCWVKSIKISLEPPSLKDNTGDIDRLVRGLKKELQAEKIRISFSLIKKIPYLLREYDYTANAVLYSSADSWYVIDLFPPGYKGNIYGISIDLGSSTLVMRLLDLINGDSVDEVSFLNPQVATGTDILTRIHYAEEEGGLEKLQEVLIKEINRVIKGLSEKHKIERRYITGLSVAGNTAMTHFFLGLNPHWICREPYIPVINSPDIIRSADVGIEINSDAPIFVLPGAGSYLGGDIVAGIIASGINRRKEISILVDVGTNAEVVLGNSDWLMACAGAAGPALEGGVASMGMMAGLGAIDKVVINPHTNKFEIRTIGDSPPSGICGSGLIDLAGQLFLSGMIDLRGKFVDKKCGDRLVVIDGIKNLIVVPASESVEKKDLYLSQTDVDALLRSKAAMYTILNTITSMADIPFKDIERFYIAGVFGAYINPASAISIGMIPDLPLSRYASLGNSSIEGASMALLSSKAVTEARKIREMITYIELNVNQEFMNNFNAAKFIPHTDRSLFPSVKEW